MAQHKPLNPKLSSLWHGGDYNPEQWPRAVWDEDMALMQKARCNVCTVGVFSWVTLEPEEGRFEFGWLDDLLDLLQKSGRYAVLATPSAAPPAWLSRAYPGTLRVGADGVPRKHGNRVNFCWTSPIYRRKTREVAEHLAKRYGNHPALLMWHVSNEYGGECRCGLCRYAFVQWLQRKFGNDLDKLNAAYWTRFWGHTYTDWDQIEIPGPPYGETSVQGLTLDWRRFMSDQIVDFMRNESEPLREHAPEVPITTNLMGFYEGLDPWRIAPYVDVATWDSYPEFLGRPIEWQDWAKVAMTHDLNRSLKKKPFLLIESTPSSSNWYPAMTLKPDSRHHMEGIQALAHGSEGVMYFQWRQSRGGLEKFHGAVIGHGFTSDSRVFRDVQRLGEELDALGEIVGAYSPAEVALIYDWENAWAIAESCGPIQGDKGYFATALDLYRPFWEQGVTVDVISSSCAFEDYKLVVAPMLYLLRPGVAEKLSEFVSKGGTLVSTYLTGWVDENDLIFESGYLGPLAEVFGIRVEEIDALYPGRPVRIQTSPDNGLGLEGDYQAEVFCELIHTHGAEVLATYGDRFYAGRPAVTRNRFGQGQALYIASRNDHKFHRRLVSALLSAHGIEGALSPLPEGVIAQKRGDYIFLMNCKEEPQEVILPADLIPIGETTIDPVLPPFGTKILKAAGGK